MQSAPQPPFPLFDCWSFFCIILTSSTYNIKCREVTRVVIWRHMNFIEVSNYSKILSSYSIHATSCAYPVQSKKYDTDWRDASLSQKNTQPFMLTFTYCQFRIGDLPYARFWTEESEFMSMLTQEEANSTQLDRGLESRSVLQWNSPNYCSTVRPHV